MNGIEKGGLTKVLLSIFVFLNVEGKTKEEVLFNVSSLAKKSGLISNEKALYEELAVKERSVSSVIGSGIVVPESRCIRADRAYAFLLCRLKYPVDFKSQYRRSVRIIRLSLGSKKADLKRFKAMLYLTALLKSAEYRKRLMQVKGAAEVYGILKEIAHNYAMKLGKTL